ncbi:MAG: hypothetical protein IT514_07800, partial [Burkholderiales bacterium]|nr:hypothetical protein [Burkholderiales bacterium]
DTVAVRLTSAAALGVTVTATLAVGAGSAGFSVTTGLPVPTGLIATPVGPTRIDLTWSAVAGAAGSRLYRGGVLVATLGAVTARSDTGLDPATPYSYTLAACDAGSNCSAQSAPAAATTLAASYLLSVAVNGPGSIASNPAGIDCGASCSHSFTTLSIVTLTALAGTGKSFTGWSGACVGVGPCQVTISAARSVTANFTDGLVVPLPAGFGLTGNALDAPLDVISLFGSQEAATAYTGVVDAVWSWNASTGKWRFHTPQLTLAQSAAYAAANGYEALASVPAGEGYWVNAYAPVNLPAQQGAPFDYDAAAFAARPPQVFNLLSIGVQKPVSQFIAAVGGFNALWAWDAWRARWYFHSPALEQEGAPFSSCEYAANLHYLDFNGCSAANNAAGVPVAPAPPLELTPGMGFWVEKN